MMDYAISLADLWWFFRWPILCALWASAAHDETGVNGLAALIYTIFFANFGV